MKDIAYRVSVIAVGMLFLFSGVAKAINPFGLSVQFGDYFTAMGLDFLKPFSSICAVALPTFEMLIGVLLLLGYYRKGVAWIVLSVMSFFTGLTLWIALENPVSDCGCFGDLFVISNWATFYKNVAFMLPTVLLFCMRGRGECLRKGWRSVLVIAMIVGLLPLYSYNNLPIIDSTPYKIGVNVFEAMHDGKEGESKTTLLYKNISSGEVVEFEIEDTTWTDGSKWEFVDSKTAVMRQAVAPSIAQLPMIDSQGVDRAEEVLCREGEVALLVVPMPRVQSEDIAVAVSELRGQGVEDIVILHSSLSVMAIEGVEVYTTDNSTLKTIVQHHGGGVVLLSDGVISSKRTF
ncbi:MAG: DoxX family protein [Rikenellaceae bacterium]